MKTIYLVRHGKAVTRDTGISDYERTLIERGESDSLKIAERLKNCMIKPSLIISSPAPRALGTAKIFAKQLEYLQKKIATRKAMYDQSDGALLDIVHTVDDIHDSVMLVGHNPSIEEFGYFLIRNFNEIIPTCGVVGISCKAASWKDVSQGRGKMILFESPKSPEKPENKKLLRKGLEKKLAEQICDILSAVNTNAKEKIEKQIKKSSGDIVKKFVQILTKGTKKKAKK